MVLLLQQAKGLIQSPFVFLIFLEPVN
jgi:hypothetical protein